MKIPRFDYEGRPNAPQGAEFDAALARWSALKSDPDAHFDREVRIEPGYGLEGFITDTSFDTTFR